LAIKEKAEEQKSEFEKKRKKEKKKRKKEKQEKPLLRYVESQGSALFNILVRESPTKNILAMWNLLMKKFVISERFASKLEN